MLHPAQAAPALLALLVVFGVMLPAHVVGQCTFQNEIDTYRKMIIAQVAK